MENVSKEYLDFINDTDDIGRSMKNKVVIDNVEYLSDIIKSNPKISHKATSFIGGFPAKTCDFEIFNLDGSLSLNNKEIEVYKGLFINGSIEWVKMGIFKAKDEDITTNLSTKSIHFKGKDRRTLFDEIYSSNLTYPATGLQIIQDICNSVGVTLETTDFNMANYTFTKKPNFSEATTFTEAVARMAEAGGEIAFISRNGGLRIVGQTKTNQTIPKSKRSSLTKEKQFGAINTVVLGMDGYDDDIVYQVENLINKSVTKNILPLKDLTYIKANELITVDEITNNSLQLTIEPNIATWSSIQFPINDLLEDGEKYTLAFSVDENSDALPNTRYGTFGIHAVPKAGGTTIKIDINSSRGTEVFYSGTMPEVVDKTNYDYYLRVYPSQDNTITENLTFIYKNIYIAKETTFSGYVDYIPAGVIEWKITNNPYFDLNREEIIETIANNIIGKSVIPYTIDNFVDDFIYDLNDVVSAIDNDGNTFDAVILQYETASRIKSNIAVPAQTETTTNYNAAGNKNSNNISGSVKLIVNHLTKIVEAIAQKIVDTSEYIKTVTGQGNLHLERTAESNAMIKKLVIKGFTQQPLYLSDTTYLSDNTYLGASTHYCILEKTTNVNYTYNEETGELIYDADAVNYENEELTINDDFNYENEGLTQSAAIRHDIYVSEPLRSGIFNNISITDDLVIENNKCYVIRRLGIDADDNLYVLDETITEEYEDVILSTFEENTYLSMENYSDVSFECLYMQENEYADYFATQVLYNSNFTITDENINSKVSRDHIVSEINQSAEMIKILANKIQLEGYTTINGGFAVDLEGNASIANGAVKINGEGIQMVDGTKIVGGDGLLTNLQDENGWMWLGFFPDEEMGMVTKDTLKLQVNIPEKYKVNSAKVILMHAPIHFEGETMGAAYDFWGYARKMKLYKNTNHDFSVNASAFSEYYETDNSSYEEIKNAFGANGFTAKTPTNNNHETERVESIDFSSSVDAGFNEFAIFTDESTPALAGDFIEKASYEKTGRCYAILFITGYMTI